MGTTVTMSEIPDCDFHWVMKQQHVPAAYDGKTTRESSGRGRWAYMCEECFRVNGIGLGTGRGQRLVKREG